MKFSGGAVVIHVAAGRLLAEPLADITFRSAGSLGEFAGRLRSALGQRFIESEFVANTDQCRIKRRAKIDNGLAEKFVQLVLIYRHINLQ